jgi:hypothetical protein
MYSQPYYAMIFGSWTLATLPLASPEAAGRFAYVTDRPSGAGFMFCDSTQWIDAPWSGGVPVYSNPTRALNTAVQLSTTRDAQVSYAVDVQVSSLLLGAAQGTTTLQYADNAGMSTNLVNVMSGTNRTSGVLNVVNVGTVTLTGRIPAGKYVRILTNVDSGTVSFTSRQGQEVLL